MSYATADAAGVGSGPAERMNLNCRRLCSWPFALAVLFFLTPLLLFHLYPSSFWANDDYEPLALADAMNLAYRLADLRMYPARA